MTPEKLAFRVVVYYEAAALASAGRIPPITHFLMKLGTPGRVAASVFAGAWMLRHLEVVRWSR